MKSLEDHKGIPIERAKAHYNQALEILRRLDLAIARPRPSTRAGLKESSAMIRVQRVLDRNEEDRARLSKQMIPSVFNDVPVLLAPVEFDKTTQRMVCVVFYAVRTHFGRHVTEKREVDGMPYRKKIDFHLIEKHFGIGYDAAPGQRMIVNAKELADGFVRNALKEALR